MRNSAHLVLLSAISLLGLGISGCGKPEQAKDPSSAAAGGDHAEVGKAAPDLEIQTLNGKGKVSLESLQGKVAIVDFWATWCGPCKVSFPKLEELSKKMGDKVQIVGVSVDDDKKGILDFAKETGATFPIGWDEGHALAGKWGPPTMPTTFILDSTGKVRFIHSGFKDGEAGVIGTELAGLLEESGGDTKVAKNDKTDANAKPDAKGSDTSKTDTAKTDSAKADDKTASADAVADGEALPPPPATTKKAAKKGGRGAGKKAPPKKTKKKKPAPADGSAAPAAT